MQVSFLLFVCVSVYNLQQSALSFAFSCKQIQILKLLAMVFNISSVPGSILYAAFFILKHHPYNVYYYIRIKLKYQF